MHRHMRRKYVLCEWSNNDEKMLRAVKHRSVGSVEHLIEVKRVNPTKVNPSRGTTALHLSATRGFLEIIDVFLTLTIDVDVRDVDGRTALHCAARHARHDVTDRLLQSGADANAVDYEEWSVMHHACVGGNINCVQLLLTYGASLRHKDKLGRTALMCAVANGQASICRLLLENGANVNDTDGNNQSSLFLATTKRNAALCDYLIRNGADVNHVDNQGCNALWFATASKSEDVCRLLRRSKKYTGDDIIFTGVNVPVAPVKSAPLPLSTEMRSRTASSYTQQQQFTTIHEEQLVGPDITDEHGASNQGSNIVPHERSLSHDGPSPSDVHTLPGPSNVMKLSADGEMASFGLSTKSRDSETSLSSIDIIDPPEEFRQSAIGRITDVKDADNMFMQFVGYYNSDLCERRLTELNEEKLTLQSKIDEMLTAVSLLTVIRSSLAVNSSRIKSYLRWVCLELLRLHGYFEALRLNHLRSSSSGDVVVITDPTSLAVLARRVQLIIWFLESLARLGGLRTLIDIAAQLQTLSNVEGVRRLQHRLGQPCGLLDREEICDNLSPERQRHRYNEDNYVTSGTVYKDTQSGSQAVSDEEYSTVDLSTTHNTTQTVRTNDEAASNERLAEVTGTPEEDSDELLSVKLVQEEATPNTSVFDSRYSYSSISTMTCAEIVTATSVQSVLPTTTQSQIVPQPPQEDNQDLARGLPRLGDNSERLLADKTEFFISEWKDSTQSTESGEVAMEYDASISITMESDETQEVQVRKLRIENKSVTAYRTEPDDEIVNREADFGETESSEITNPVTQTHPVTQIHMVTPTRTATQSHSATQTYPVTQIHMVSLIHPVTQTHLASQTYPATQIHSVTQTHRTDSDDDSSITRKQSQDKQSLRDVGDIQRNPGAHQDVATKPDKDTEAERLIKLHSMLAEKCAQVEMLSSELDCANRRLNDQVEDFQTTIVDTERKYQEQIEGLEKTFAALEHIIMASPTLDSELFGADALLDSELFGANLLELRAAMSDEENTGIDSSMCDSFAASKSEPSTGRMATSRDPTPRLVTDISRDLVVKTPHVTSLEQNVEVAPDRTEVVLTVAAESDIDDRDDDVFRDVACPGPATSIAVTGNVGEQLIEQSSSEGTVTQRGLVEIQKTYIDDLVSEISALEKTVMHLAQTTHDDDDIIGDYTYVLYEPEARLAAAAAAAASSVQPQARATAAETDVRLQENDILDGVERSVVHSSARREEGVCITSLTSSAGVPQHAQVIDVASEEEYLSRRQSAGQSGQLVPGRSVIQQQNNSEFWTTEERTVEICFTGLNKVNQDVFNSAVSDVDGSPNGNNLSTRAQGDQLPLFDQHHRIEPVLQVGLHASGNLPLSKPDIIAFDNNNNNNNNDNNNNNRDNNNTSHQPYDRLQNENEAARLVVQQLSELCNWLRRGDFASLASSANEDLFDNSEDLVFIVSQFQRIVREKKILEEKVTMLDDEIESLIDELWRKDRYEGDKKLPVIAEESGIDEIEQLRRTIDAKEQELAQLRATLRGHAALIDDLQAKVADVESAVTIKHKLTEQLRLAESEMKELKRELAASKSSEKTHLGVLKNATTDMKPRFIHTERREEVVEEWSCQYHSKRDGVHELLTDTGIALPVPGLPDGVTFVEETYSRAASQSEEYGAECYDSRGGSTSDSSKYDDTSESISNLVPDIEHHSTVEISCDSSSVWQSTSDVQDKIQVELANAIGSTATSFEDVISCQTHIVETGLIVEQLTGVDIYSGALTGSDGVTTPAPMENPSSPDQLHLATSLGGMSEADNQEKEKEQIEFKTDVVDGHRHELRSDDVRNDNVTFHTSSRDVEISYAELVAKTKTLEEDNHRLVREIENLELILELEKLKKFPEVHVTAVSPVKKVRTAKVDKATSPSTEKPSLFITVIDRTKHVLDTDTKTDTENSQQFTDHLTTKNDSISVGDREEREGESDEDGEDDAVGMTNSASYYVTGEETHGYRVRDSSTQHDNSDELLADSASGMFAIADHEARYQLATVDAETTSVLVTGSLQQTSMTSSTVGSSIGGWGRGRYWTSDREFSRSSTSNVNLVKELHAENKKLEQFIEILARHVTRRTASTTTQTFSTISTSQSSGIVASSSIFDSMSSVSGRRQHRLNDDDVVTVDESLDTSMYYSLDDVSLESVGRRSSLTTPLPHDTTATSSTLGGGESIEDFTTWNDSTDSLLTGCEGDDSGVRSSLEHTAHSETVVAELRQQFQVNENNYNTTVDSHRRHLSEAPEDVVNPELRETQLNIVHIQQDATN